jgi:hypothetical protein
MKKILTALLAFTFVFGSSTVVNAAIDSVGDPGRAWSIPNDAERGMHIQEFIDFPPNEIASELVDAQRVRELKDDPTCKSASDPRCVGRDLGYKAVVPNCLTDTDVNCTEDFGIIDASGARVSANFGRFFPAKAMNEFIGDPSRHIPNGVAGSIYSLPQATHDGGNLYYLSVILSGNIWGSGKSSQPELNVRITPVKLEQSNYYVRSNDSEGAGWALIKDGYTGEVRWGHRDSGWEGDQYCVASSAQEKLCAQKYAFPVSTRFYVTVRASQLPVGWMHGRISSPDIQITSGNGFSRIEIQGNPIAVPAVYKMYRYPEMPSALKAMYDVEKGGYKPDCPAEAKYCAGGRSGASTDPMGRNVIIAPEAWQPSGMDQLKLWLPYVNDKATALLSFWSARTLGAQEMNGANRCFSDTTKITGIVSTNSTQYSAGPPTFNQADGTLDYKVASPHYGTTGDVFKGTYDLVMRSEVARCIYGFSKAPINATLSITSSDGTPQLATTVIGEKNGWLYLQARNFEFSAPIIQAKLTQEAEVVAAPTPTPTPTPSASAKPAAKAVTITCIKGKTSKKVTAVKPKCPTGYKKK